jgi:hypothetical protein
LCKAAASAGSEGRGLCASRRSSLVVDHHPPRETHGSYRRAFFLVVLPMTFLDR